VRSDWRERDRAAEVREAAHWWRKTGAAEPAVSEKVETLWPSEGPTIGPLWQLLIFVFVLIAGWALLAFVGLMTRPDGRIGFGLLGTGYGLAAALVTEWILARYRFAPTGAGAATSFIAVVCLAWGPLVLLLPHGMERDLGRIVAAWGAALLAGAAWRWGMWPYAGGSAAAFLLLLGSFPGGRGMIIVAAAAMALLASRGAGSPTLCASHRRGVEAVLAVALAGLSLAVNRFSLDHAWVEELIPHTWQSIPDAGAGPTVQAVSAVATALLPLAVLFWGLRGRRRVTIDLAVLMGAASAVTLRAYVQIAPLWVILSGSGLLLVAGALLLIRFLEGGPEGERSGFTAASLVDERRREQLLPVVAALAATPDARAIEQKAGFSGQGGGFGGGGAQAGF
jgi:hypothetical protein